MIETNEFILKDNNLFVERIIERIKEYEERLSKYMREQPNFINQNTFYMYSAVINELYLLLTSYNNQMIISKRDEQQKNNKK